MQIFLSTLLITFVLSSCGQATNYKENSSKDTLVVSEEEGTPDIKKLRKEYIHNYKAEIEFESFNKGRGSESIKVWGKYYCLFDSAVVVPGKYNFDDTTKSFTTHSFAEDLVVISNGDTILKRTITKNNFVNTLPSYLKDYAVLFEPKFEGYDSSKDVFDFSFSVSIPMTDVGQLMFLSIRRNGQVLVKEAE